MGQIKIIQIKANSPKERANLIQELQNINENIICRGSIYYEYNNELFADVYFQKGESEIRELGHGNSVVEHRTNKSNGDGATPSHDPNVKFKPTKKLLEKWAKQPISEKTKKLLVNRHKMEESEVKKLTQLEAHQLIESLESEFI